MASAAEQAQISERFRRIRELYAETTVILQQEGPIVGDDAWAQIRQIDARIAQLWLEVYALEAGRGIGQPTENGAMEPARKEISNRGFL